MRGAAAQHAIAARETCHQSPCGARDAAVRNPSRRRRCFRRQPACPGRAQRPAWTPQQQSSRRWSPRDGTASLPLRIAAASNRGRSPQSGARQALPNEVKWRRARITKRERAQKRKRFGPRAAPSAPIRAPLSSLCPLYNVFVPWIHERRAGTRASRPRCSARGSERFRVQAGAREAAAPGGVLRAPRTAEQPRRGAPARIHWDTTVVCDVRVDEGCASRRVSRRTGARRAARPAETCLLRD